MNKEIFEHNIKCLMKAIVQKMERKDIITYGEEQEIQSIVEAVFYQSLDELVKENKQLYQELQRKDNIINAVKNELSDDKKFELFYADENINTVMTLGAKYYREYILDKIKDIENAK